MSSPSVRVVKRNGETELFAAGRIALAIFKASQALRPPLPAHVGRKLGSDVGSRVGLTVSERGPIEVGVDDVQDEIVLELRRAGYIDLAESYQSYRDGRKQEQSRAVQVRKVERGFKFPVNGGSFEFSRDAWAKALSSALSFGVGPDWDVPSWWEVAKDEASMAKNFDDFVGVHIKTLIDVSSDKPSWLRTASSLLLERWCRRTFGGGDLLCGSAEALKLERAHFKSYWSARKLNQKSNWFPPGKDLDAISKLFTVDGYRGHGFSGLVELERVFGFGKEALTPNQLWANAAIALSYSPWSPLREGVERLGLVQKIFTLFASGQWIPSFNLLRQSKLASPCVYQESFIEMGDSLEKIFDGLALAASSGKSGSSVCVDLTSLRAEGAGVGDSGQISGGVAPVLRLFGEASGMLSGRDGERQKSRLSMACWHGDLENFLAFSRSSPKEMRLAIYIPDIFMKRVFEGGGWVLASPSDAPHLLSSRGADFERWVRDYAQMAGFGGLGKAKSVPARDVFSWICDCIAHSGGPSIVFSDACIRYSTPAEPHVLSARLSDLFAAGGGSANTMEIGVNVKGMTVEGAAELIVGFYDVFSAFTPSNDLRYVASVVGDMKLEDFARLNMSLGSRLLKYGCSYKKGALWLDKNPWDARLRQIAGTRGGYLELPEEIQETVEDCSRKSGPSRLLSLSSREEYLWLSDNSPIYVDRVRHRRTVSFGGARAGFGGSGDFEPLKEQVRRMSSWQKWVDSSVAWDARLDQVDASTVSEVIKLAWLHGLTCVRRFVGQRVA